jgi:hypothetical protein
MLALVASVGALSLAVMRLSGALRCPIALLPSLSLAAEVSAPSLLTAVSQR